MVRQPPSPDPPLPPCVSEKLERTQSPPPGMTDRGAGDHLAGVQRLALLIRPLRLPVDPRPRPPVAIRYRGGVQWTHGGGGARGPKNRGPFISKKFETKSAGH